MRIIITFLIVFHSFQGYADYGKAYIIKCDIVTTDTIITGYIVAPYEWLSDSTIHNFKHSNNFLTNKILKDLLESKSRDAIDVYKFVYRYKLPSADFHDPQMSYALYKSAEKSSITETSIIKLIYHDIIIFDSWGYGVTSPIEPSDTIWLQQNPRLFKIDKKDPCCPEAYLLHDGSSDYESLIEELISTPYRETEKIDRLRNELRKHKVTTVYLCECG